jgi:hypothetical protein
MAEDRDELLAEQIGQAIGMATQILKIRMTASDAIPDLDRLMREFEQKNLSVHAGCIAGIIEGLETNPGQIPTWSEGG